MTPFGEHLPTFQKHLLPQYSGFMHRRYRPWRWGQHTPGVLNLDDKILQSKLLAATVCTTLTLRRIWVTTVAKEEQLSIKNSKCMSVALVIQHVKNMHLITLPFVACWSYHIIPHYFINSTIFRGVGEGSYWTQNTCF